MEEEDKYTRITLRIPKDLHALLNAEADRTSKSLNAEIIGRLESTFAPQRELFTPTELKSLVEDAVRVGMSKMRLRMFLRSDGALDIYGDHQAAFTTLVRAGIEVEEKHDHHQVPPKAAAAAQNLLEKDRLFHVDVTDESALGEAFEIPAFPRKAEVEVDARPRTGNSLQAGPEPLEPAPPPPKPRTRRAYDRRKKP